MDRIFLFLELPRATSFLKKVLLRKGRKCLAKILGNKQDDFIDLGERVEHFDVEETYLTTLLSDAEEKLTRRVKNNSYFINSNKRIPVLIHIQLSIRINRSVLILKNK